MWPVGHTGSPVSTGQLPSSSQSGVLVGVPGGVLVGVPVGVLVGVPGQLLVASQESGLLVTPFLMGRGRRMTTSPDCGPTWADACATGKSDAPARSPTIRNLRRIDPIPTLHNNVAIL